MTEVKKSVFSTGAAGRQKVKTELDQKKNKGFAPIRFRLKPGEEGEVILLDSYKFPEMNEYFSVWEHAIMQPNQKFPIFETCIKDTDNCPMCQSQGDSYNLMVLTVLDLRPYTDKEGNEVKFSKKLLAIKSSSQDEMLKWMEDAYKEYGTTRGLKFKMRRPDDNKSAGTGKPVALNMKTVVEIISEETLLRQYGNDEIRSKDKTILYKAKNENIQTLKYYELFAPKTFTELRATYGNIGGKQEQSYSNDKEDDYGMEMGEDTSAIPDDGIDLG